MLHDRLRLRTALPAVAASIAICLLPVAPAAAEPTIEEVEERVDRLYHRAEVASERALDAGLKLREQRRALTSVRAAEARAAKRAARAQGNLEDSVVRQYEGESAAAVSSLIVSEDPDAFLDQLTTMAALTEAQSDIYEDQDLALRALELRRRETSLRVAELAATEKRQRADEAEAEERLARAKALLAELEAEERAALLAGTSSLPVPSSVPASGRAAAAVQYALAQVGDAYVYGAMGPDAFDCSGLTSMAWAQAGVGLPHSSGAQAGSGAPVSSGSLQPGDLVFYYSPISHVGMYIGNGLIVHAGNPSTGVEVTGLFAMPFSGAVRPG